MSTPTPAFVGWRERLRVRVAELLRVAETLRASGKRDPWLQSAYEALIATAEEMALMERQFEEGRAALVGAAVARLDVAEAVREAMPPRRGGLAAAPRKGRRGGGAASGRAKRAKGAQ